MLRLAGDPELRAELGRKNRERAHTEFTVDQMVRRTFTLVDGLLANGKRSGANS